MNTVWLLMGQSGDYEDHSEWVVGAFSTRQAADERLRLMLEAYQKYVVRVQEFRDGDGDYWDTPSFDLDDRASGDLEVVYCVIETTLNEPVKVAVATNRAQRKAYLKEYGGKACQ
jgi:hypothetical protein